MLFKKPNDLLRLGIIIFHPMAHYLRKRERGIFAESNPLEILGCKAAGLKVDKA
jgi:hypothetical protein